MFAQMSSKVLTPRQPGSPSRWLLWAAAMRAWLFLALLLIVFETWSRISYGTSFVFSTYNAQSIAVFAVAPLLLALGETFVIIAGGIDLSVGFIMGLSAVVAAHGANVAGAYMPPFPAMLVGISAGLLVCLIPGSVNGWLISKLKVPPFIGTLGMFGVARGVAFLLANGTTVPVSNNWFAALGNGRLLGFPVVVIITVLFVLVMSYLLRQTQFGQHTYAIGASEQAALRAGINVARHTRKLYLLSALCAGLGGVLYAARFTAGAAQAGEPLLLDSIAAVVIGGASLFGGSGTILGTVAGSLVIAVIQYGLVFIDVEPFWQFVAVGVVIIISVLVDQTQRKLGGER
ncbi:ABC transporter permease subunit [Lichenihabitans psoromatis]|uniref:ABC transporter permease subunit n=1 Tax=Lichenihabitans psoromatis TaxID=2528642 RepID=UPI001035DE06|nr:ribose ABC transporter [Lichenihabitans psoromatis]